MQSSLAGDVKVAMELLRRNGLEASASNARYLFEQAIRLWEEQPSPEVEVMVLQAGIIFQARRATSPRLQWYDAIVDQLQDLNPQRPYVRRLFALFLANTVIARRMKQVHPPCDRVTLRIAQKAVNIFRETEAPTFCRWKGNMLVMLAYYTLLLDGSSARTEAVKYAREALAAFKESKPSLSIYGFAQGLASGDEPTVPGNRVIRGEKRVCWFSPEDLFYFQV